MCKPDFDFFSTDVRFKTVTGTFLSQRHYVVANYQSKKQIGVHGCAILCSGMGETLKYPQCTSQIKKNKRGYESIVLKVYDLVLTSWRFVIF